MKQVLMAVALLSATQIFCDPAVELMGTEIKGLTERRGSCEEQVKKLHQEIAELNERIARAQSALEVKKVEMEQRAVATAPRAEAAPVA